MTILLNLTNFIIDVIETMGYPGIFLIMVLEGIMTPIPSEIIMPFAGYLSSPSSHQSFNLYLVILVGTLGATVGSTVAYYIGYYLGRGFILKYGKYIFLSEERLERVEQWFEKYGNKAIFFGHSIPGTRSFISFPAGIAKMNIGNFIVYTFCGALIWTSVLSCLGFWLGEQWMTIVDTVEILDAIVIVTLIISLIVYYLVYRNKNKKNQIE